MKKGFLSLAIVALAALGFSSCESKACWKVTGMSAGGSQVVYFYGTAAECDTQAVALLKGNGMEVKKEKTSKSESDCRTTK